MERLILKNLLDWKNSPYRKPADSEGCAAGRQRPGFSKSSADAIMKIPPILISMKMKNTSSSLRRQKM